MLFLRIQTPNTRNWCLLIAWTANIILYRDRRPPCWLMVIQPMHTYDFLNMVYCFLGCALLNDSFRVKKSIICIRIVIYTHSRSIINSSLLGVNIEITDQAVISCQVIARSLFWHADCNICAAHIVAIHTSKFLHGVIIPSMHLTWQDPKGVGSSSLIHTLTFS